MSKPWIDAAARNKDAILEVLRDTFSAATRVLEIGAGTGQHAVHFAAAMPHLVWQTSDLPAALPGITAWVEEAALPNLPAPLVLDVTGRGWPRAGYDAVYASNLVHYMPWPAVEATFAGIGALLAAGGRFALYGPFNVGGRHVSDGNRQLDAWLRAQHPAFGIRDRDELSRLGARHGLGLCEDHGLPANNRLLVWQR